MTEQKERADRLAEAAKGDELSGEIAIRANIDETGLNVAGKSAR